MKRNPYRVVWLSSYDRGLQHLLKMWPEVIQAVPEAELHIFYGWNLFDVAYSDNPERQAWKRRLNEKMNQPGIIHRGRLGQRDILKELDQASVWAYPTDFDEINCINALKCQIHGVIPVVIDRAALKESVLFGDKIEGDIYDPQVQAAFKEALIKRLLNPDNDKLRTEMMRVCKDKFSWQSVATVWEGAMQ
jgi:hypothetical protein